MHDDRDHVVSVVLSHEDWKEFVKLQPQPSDWLRERIREMLMASRPEGASSASSASPACV